MNTMHESPSSVVLANLIPHHILLHNTKIEAYENPVPHRLKKTKQKLLHRNHTDLHIHKFWQR